MLKTSRSRSQSTPPHVRARIESRDARLQALGFKNYTAYLKSAAWQSKRIQYRATPDLVQVCGLCVEPDGTQLHHMTYERVGEELLTDLIPLCAKCHQIVHVLERRGEITLDFQGIVDFERAARYAVEQDRRKHQSLEDIRESTMDPENLRIHARRIKALIDLRAEQLSAEDFADLCTDIREILDRIESLN